MATVQRWTGREVRYLRQALRQSVRGFADYLGVPPRTISKWEQHGDNRTPRPEFQAMLDTALARASDEEQTRFATAAGLTAVLPTSPEPDALSSLPRLGLTELRAFSRALSQATELAEAELLPYFERALSRCQRQDGSHGPVQALPATLGLLAALEASARRVRPPVRRHLLCLAARGSEFVGWLYRDAGALEQATYWYDRGTEWAQEAGSAPLQGYILLRRSQLAYDLRDGVRVLSLAEATQTGPWQLPGRVQAEAAQQQALGLAMTGRSATAVEHQLGQARRLLDAAPETDETSTLLGTTFTTATLDLRSAACYTEAGRPAVAVDLLGQVLGAGGLSRRDTGYFQARQAAALVACTEPDAAAELALTATTAATATASLRTRRVVAGVVEQLQPWCDRPAVRTLQEAVAG